MKTVMCAAVFRAVLASACLAGASAVGAADLPENAMFSVAAYAPTIRAAAENSTKKSRKRSAQQPGAKKQSKGGGVSFHDGSAESRSERDRRLTRECRGRPNSGVCQGYAY